MRYKQHLLFLFLACLVYVIQDIFTRIYFAEASARFISSIQSWSINEPFLFDVSVVISDLSFFVTGMMLMYVVWGGENRIHMVNYGIILAAVTSFMSILKLLYNDPRPYMVYAGVVGKECNAEYGNPSGHAMLNTFAGIYGMSVVGGPADKKFKIACAIYGVFLFWVGFSRVHLGVHGVNQVVLGWVYSFLFFALFRGLLFSKVNYYIKKFSTLKNPK